ncbi:ABC transporter substrate-binding protein [Chondrinema litorale]|uniref:ABC transporter substrate-binding protein n=1 Tax=Chondrinema litorale TaxID=2994555 RepID=UPI0025427F82|nr:helical backbone metal receptor [Chondrinema litorale]UZR98158.1 helical backbone metal receptor [Chondrinema litorale]
MEVLDQLGKIINTPSPDKLRIVSLVPSQTELLYDLGLNEEVFGVTKFCIKPENWRKQKTVVGGTKAVKFEKVADLQPNLILANKEENEKSQIEQLAEKYPVWTSDIQTLEEALMMIKTVSTIVGKEGRGTEIIDRITTGFNTLNNVKTAENSSKKSAAYFIWRQPMMLVGGDTFINEMMDFAGFYNVMADQNRYPEVDKETLQNLNPDYILLSSEPFPFAEKHIPEFQEICPNATILLVDGEMFSWYGSRLLVAPAYFKSIIKSL